MGPQALRGTTGMQKEENYVSRNGKPSLFQDLNSSFDSLVMETPGDAARYLSFIDAYALCKEKC
jgi:hypothetical protein